MRIGKFDSFLLAVNVFIWYVVIIISRSANYLKFVVLLLVLKTICENCFGSIQSA